PPTAIRWRKTYRFSSVRFSTVTTASVTIAATAAIAAHTGSRSAPTTPSVSGTSMIVTPSRVFTSSRRAFPSSTSALIRPMTRSTSTVPKRPSTTARALRPADVVADDAGAILVREEDVVVLRQEAWRRGRVRIGQQAVAHVEELAALFVAERAQPRPKPLEDL